MTHSPISQDAAIRQRATELLNALQDKMRSTSEPSQYTAAAMLALAATIVPAASIGTCGMDGTDMYFVGKSDGLYVCCGGSPQHCWKVGS